MCLAALVRGGEEIALAFHQNDPMVVRGSLLMGSTAAGLEARRRCSEGRATCQRLSEQFVG